MILSIDTTTEFGSIALTEHERVIEEVLLHAPDGFGHILFLRIENLLARHGLTVRQMDCFAAASGPGSFTGVRIGLTAVKGLAETTGKRVVAVSNLRALAVFGNAPLRATVLDARRGEVYGGLYNDKLEAVVAEAVMPFQSWIRTLPAEGFEFISTDFGPFQSFVDPAVPVVTARRALAAAIGLIAAKEPGVDPGEADANYIRRSDAELKF